MGGGGLITAIAHCNDNEVYRAIKTIIKGNVANTSLTKNLTILNWATDYALISNPPINTDNTEYIAISSLVYNEHKRVDIFMDEIDITNFSKIHIICKERRDSAYAYTGGCVNYWSLNVTKDRNVIVKDGYAYRLAIAHHGLESNPNLSSAVSPNKISKDTNGFFRSEMDIKELTGKVRLAIEGCTQTDNRNHTLEIYDIYLEC